MKTHVSQLVQAVSSGYLMLAQLGSHSSQQSGSHPYKLITHQYENPPMHDTCPNSYWSTQEGTDEVLYMDSTMGNTSAVCILPNCIILSVHTMALPVTSPLKNSSTRALSAGSSSFESDPVDYFPLCYLQQPRQELLLSNLLAGPSS